jgi:hypothetical protein
VPKWRRAPASRVQIARSGAVPLASPACANNPRGRYLVALTAYAQTPSVEVLAGVALIGIWIGIRHYAARRIAAGQGRFVWLAFAPNVLLLMYVLWIAVGLWVTHPLIAVGIGLLAVPSLALFTRGMRRMAADTGKADVGGNLVSSFSDYFIWFGIGVPFVFAVLLLLLLITGELGNSH